MKMKVTKICINMYVKSIEETIKWYKETLGWKSQCDLKNEKGECLFGDVYYSREPELGFNLIRKEQVSETKEFHPLLKVEDIEALEKELKSKGVELVQELTNQPWGRNLKIMDVNGFILEFWADLEQD
ncbi:MAG: VOC family protein [Asgard group archaeon]|nr:VOC family protein [Asgard group archaeon]